MAYESNLPNIPYPNIFNPFALWADLGMRAADMAVSSSQSMNDAVDRLTRASASAEPDDVAIANAVPADAPSAFGLQRSMLELMTQNWVRWMSTMGGLMSVGAGIGLAHKLTRQDNPLEAAHTNLRPAAWGDKPATRQQVGSLDYPSRRTRAGAGMDNAQHAVASAESKPRRKAASKSSSSRRKARASK